MTLESDKPNELMDTGKAARIAREAAHEVAEEIYQRFEAALTNKLQDVTTDVKTIRRMKEEEKRQRTGFIAIWVWIKNSLSHAAEEAKKIRIE